MLACEVKLALREEQSLPRARRWMTRRVRRYHAHYGTGGPLWQQRDKSVPMHDDEHFLTVFRHMLRNPVRAGLAASPNGARPACSCRT